MAMNAVPGAVPAILVPGEDGLIPPGGRMEWRITEHTTLINNEESSHVGLSDLFLRDNSFITVRIGNKEDAEYPGGFNLFGQKFGDYEQDINMSFVY